MPKPKKEKLVRYLIVITKYENVEGGFAFSTRKERDENLERLRNHVANCRYDYTTYLDVDLKERVTKDFARRYILSLMKKAA